jgi:hypothetical protein
MRERELAHLGVAALHGASVVGSIGASGGARTGLIGAGVGALTAMGPREKDSAQAADEGEGARGTTSQEASSDGRPLPRLRRGARAQREGRRDRHPVHGASGLRRRPGVRARSSTPQAREARHDHACPRRCARHPGGWISRQLDEGLDEPAAGHPTGDDGRGCPHGRQRPSAAFGDGQAGRPLGGAVGCVREAGGPVRPRLGVHDGAGEGCLLPGDGTDGRCRATSGAGYRSASARSGEERTAEGAGGVPGAGG